MSTLVSSLYLWNVFIFHMFKWIRTHPAPWPSPFMEADTRALTPINVCFKVGRKRYYGLFKNNLSWGENKLWYNISKLNSLTLSWGKFDGQILLCSLLAILIRRLAQFVSSFSRKRCKACYCNNVKLISQKNAWRSWWDLQENNS